MPRKETPEEWRQRMQASIDKHKTAAESGATLPDTEVADHPVPCAEPPQRQQRRVPPEYLYGYELGPLPGQKAPPEWLHPRRPEPSPSRPQTKPPVRDTRQIARNNLRELDGIVQEFVAQNPLPLPLFVAMLAKTRDDVAPERLYAVHVVSEAEWSLAWPGNRAGKKPDGFWFTKRFNSNDRNMFARLLLHHQDAWI